MAFVWLTDEMILSSTPASLLQRVEEDRIDVSAKYVAIGPEDGLSEVKLPADACEARHFLRVLVRSRFQTLIARRRTAAKRRVIAKRGRLTDA